MDAREIETLRRLMAYERARTAPPAAFPALPDIPAGRYTDPAFFELERTHIWRRSWLFAGHLDEFPEVGAFRLWDHAGEPVLLVRAADGVKAYYNTCRHRGAPIVTEASGRRRLLTCRYHGWTYDLDGRLLAVKDPEDFRDLDLSCRSLISIRCERFGRFIFVNFDDDAPGLLDWLGPVADDWAEFQFDRCRLSARHTFDLDCNWKVAMEANMEVYHIANIHPATVGAMLDDRQNVNTLYDGGHARMVCPMRDGALRLRGVGVDVGADTSSAPEIETAGEIARTCTQAYNVFPNWVSPISALAIPPLLFWPLGVNRTRFEVLTVAPDWGEGEGPDMWTEDRGARLCEVLREDTEFGVWIQKSMESGGFRGVPLSYQEARIYHWNQAADRMIGAENIPEALRVRPVIGPEWIWPNDPRLAELEAAQAAQ